jgi:hypothetical protein
MNERSGSKLPTPAERAARIEHRIEELKERREQLACGVKPTEESAAAAQGHADEAMDRAQQAHIAAAARHEELAHIHERAANTLQQSVMAGIDDPRRLQDEADRHWQAAADEHEQTVEDLAQARDPARSSSGED